MKTAKGYTYFLNPSQTTVGSSDQPLFAIKKKLQWLFPLEFPISEYFPFMGCMHIEQQCLLIVGQLISGIGLEDILVSADIDIVGLKNALCDANNIKKARYAIQILTVCMYNQLTEAHKNSESNLNLTDWAESDSQCTMFKYMYGTFKFMTWTLMFVRSFREANFLLMLATLKNIVLLIFALDHLHYSRWLPVFINDLESLPITNPALYKEFVSGKFAVPATSTSFSKMAYDHIHEQNNKIIKANSGYINIVNKKMKNF